MRVARWTGVLFALGLVGSCLGVFEESPEQGPIDVSSTVTSPTSSQPVALSWTSVVTTSTLLAIETTPATRPAESQETWPDVSGSDEIDCEQAEELADWGDYEAGDIADYCDYGPDSGELPDEFDWDN